MTKSILSLVAFAFCSVAQAGLPLQLNLEYKTKNPVTGPNQPAEISNTLTTLPESAHNLNQRSAILDLMDDVDGYHGQSRIYAYRVVTPNRGMGYEYEVHPLFADQIMDAIGCAKREGYRTIITGAQWIFGDADVNSLAARAAHSERFFDTLADETRRLANYDGTKNDIPYYEPQIRAPGRAIGFTCRVYNGHDDDGVALTDLYTGMFVGDFYDYSGDAGGDPKTGAAGRAKLGYLVLSAH